MEEHETNTRAIARVFNITSKSIIKYIIQVLNNIQIMRLQKNKQTDLVAMISFDVGSEETLDKVLEKVTILYTC